MSDRDLHLSEEDWLELEKREAAQERRLDDLRCLCASPCGQRFLFRLLDESGIARQSGAGEGEITLRNFGLAIMTDIARADAAAARNLLAELWNVGK